jgi:hypothetical protein
MAGNDDNVQSAIFVDLSDDDGLIASHPEQVTLPNRVAPSLLKDGTHNTIKPFLIVVGCARAPDNHFQFDSSFVTPDAKGNMKRLAKLFDALTDRTIKSENESDRTPPLSIWGHADPTGSDQYNIVLSGRRAKAVFGLLVRDVDMWDELFSRPHGGDDWGAAALQTMIEEVGSPPGAPVPATEEEMKAAVKKLKQDRKARKALMLAYMDAICVKDVKGKEEKFVLTRENFLARGADKKNGRGDLQGCGEFNPVFLQSQETIDRFKKLPESSPEKPILKAVRDAANARDRRVLIFLFKPGSRINPNKWPCPHVNQSNAIGVCTKRLWSDAKRRLKPDPTEEREFRKTQDTFGCRFYHGIAQNSPCDGVHKQWVLRILQDLPREDLNPPREARPLANARFVALASDVAESPQIRGKSDENGVVRLPVFDEVTAMTLKIEVGDALPPAGGATPPQPADKDDPGIGPSEDEKNFMVFKLDAGALLVKTEDLKLNDGEALSEEKKTAVKQRLFNLGYGNDKLDVADEPGFRQSVRQFRVHHKLGAVNGDDAAVDNAFMTKLREVHDTLPQKKPAATT